MNKALFHDKEIYNVFPPEWHKDTEYGFDELVDGINCLLKFDIDSDIVEFEKKLRPKIRIDIKVMDINNSKRFWFLKYKMKMEDWENGLTQETKDDFMNKVKSQMKKNIIENRDVELPETYDNYIEIE